MGDQGGPAQRLPASGLSPDGGWWWDGTAWRPALSPDRLWRWDGRAWVAAGRSPAGSTGLASGGIVALIAGGIAVVVVTVSVLAFVAFNSRNSGQGLPVAIGSASPSSSTAAIPCDQLEHTQVHYHAALQILDRGNALSIPTGIGRTSGCFYWLHMHTGEPGIIHIEAPNDRTFTLGDFFRVWGLWSGTAQPLDATHVSSLTVSGSQELVVYVDAGSGARVFTGDPKSIVLGDHEVITIEVAPPVVDPPPAFTWPDGF